MRKTFGRTVGLALLAAATLASAALAQERTVDAGVRSSAAPVAHVRIDPRFRFLGRTQEVAVMNGRATAEQFWFGEIKDGRLRRAVVVHFERMNEGAPGAFNYPDLRMVRLGAHDYLHQSFPMPGCIGFTSAEYRAFVAAAGATMAEHCLATRFVRATTGDKRAEMILFYLEPTDTIEAAPEGLGPGGLPVGHDQPSPPETPWSRIDRRLTDEALSVITVIDGPSG